MCCSRKESSEEEKVSISQRLDAISDLVETFKKSQQIVVSLKSAKTAGLISEALQSNLNAEEKRRDDCFRDILIQMTPLRSDLKKIEALCLDYCKQLKSQVTKGYQNLLIENKRRHVTVLLESIADIHSQVQVPSFFDVPDLIVSFMNNIKLLTDDDNEFYKVVCKSKNTISGFFRQGLYGVERGYIAELKEIARSYPDKASLREAIVLINPVV